MRPSRPDGGVRGVTGRDMTGAAALAVLLHGTADPVPGRRTLVAGRLTAELDGGTLRYVRWDGREVLRAIGFVVRDTRWGTYAPVLDDARVTEDARAFRVRYRATCDGPEGCLTYTAEIDGHADGRLRFAASAATTHGFTTNRAGCVVLHGLDGVIGRPLTVTHVSGGVTRTTFPPLVQPHQPATDIAALCHDPADGLRVTVTFTGDTFEMEDQRNWTDASFKTYSRPLALGFPYRLEPGATVTQAVAVRIDGAAPAAATAAGPVAVAVGAPTGGVMPDMGLFLDGAEAAGVTPALAKAVAACRPTCLIARVDGRAAEATARAAACATAAARIGCPLGLEWLIDGDRPDAELAPLGDWLAAWPGRLRDLAIFPARGAAAVLAAARRRFPGVTLGGGAATGFTELNRDRPPRGLDFVCHATQAIVHAADDGSVMETLSALASVAASVRAMAGEVPYRIGPASIGMVPFASAPPTVPNPANRRLPLARDDPRQRGRFAAAFALGYAAAAAELGVATLTLAAPSGPFGLFHAAQPWPTPGYTNDGEAYPIAAAFAGLAALAGCRLRAVRHAAAGRLAALAADAPEGTVLWLGNLTPAPLIVAPAGAAPLTLDAYALSRVVLSAPLREVASA
jgi:hypothetical protein